MRKIADWVEGLRHIQESCVSGSSFQLQHHLPFLLRRAHFAADAIFTHVYGNEVTSRQLALMVAIAQQPGLSQSQVALEVGLDLNTCSDLVARAITKRLVRRERSTEDGRSYCLFLTEEGQCIHERALGVAQIYSDGVAAALEPDERAELIRLLRKLLDFGEM